MYNRNIKEAIKHMELLQEQLESLEQRNDMLTKQLNTAVVLLCSNRARVVCNVEVTYDRVDRYEEEIDNITTYSLQVQELNGYLTGEFSPESTPYQAVLTGIDEYIEYAANKQP